MQDGDGAMQVALRVLMAITDHTRRNSADVEELRRLAPLLRNAPPDEIACDVIQQALKRRR
jgi:hypothetical protein